MDVLSEVLRIVRLSGALFFTARLSHPWSIVSPPLPELAQCMQSENENITLFHILREGRFWAKLENGEPVLLEKGSVIIFPHSPPHVMCSNLQQKPRSILELLQFEELKGLPRLEYGEGGKSTKLICGYLKCDQQFKPLLHALPEMIILSPTPHVQKLMQKNTSGTPAHILERVQDSWMDATINYLQQEVDAMHSGSATVITRLTELMFVEVLRRYMQQLPEQSKGWLAGIRDVYIGKALQLLHAQPGRKWNVQQLAIEVGMSRSALAQRFNEVIGQPPMQYLTAWRMQLAKHMLESENYDIAAVAEQTGYDSEIAFSRAFKRHTGKPPHSWRKRSLSA